MSYSTVIQELGYPNNSKSLCYWFKEYESNGDFHKAYAGGSKYTDEQKQMAKNPTISRGFGNFRLTTTGGGTRQDKPKLHG